MILSEKFLEKETGEKNYFDIEDTVYEMIRKVCEESYHYYTQEGRYAINSQKFIRRFHIMIGRLIQLYTGIPHIDIRFEVNLHKNYDICLFFKHIPFYCISVKSQNSSIKRNMCGYMEGLRGEASFTKERYPYLKYGLFYIGNKHDMKCDSDITDYYMKYAPIKIDSAIREEYFDTAAFIIPDLKMDGSVNHIKRYNIMQFLDAIKTRYDELFPHRRKSEDDLLRHMLVSDFEHDQSKLIAFASKMYKRIHGTVNDDFMGYYKENKAQLIETYNDYYGGFLDMQINYQLTLAHTKKLETFLN